MKTTGTDLKGLISESNEILRELNASKENNTLVGVWSNRLGSEMLMCYVEEIREGQAENDKVVILREKSLQGTHLSTHVLYLREIRKVHHFKKLND